MLNYDKQDAVTSLISIFGISVSVQDVKEIISIILLVLSIANILWVLGSRIYTHVKNKEYNKIPDEVDDATKKLHDLKGSDENGKH